MAISTIAYGITYDCLCCGVTVRDRDTNGRRAKKLWNCK